MPSMRNNRRNRRNNRKTGAGYMSPAEFFNPEARQPSSTAPPITSEPVPGWVRPPMTATTVMSPNVKGGARRNSRRNTRKNRSRSSRRNERQSRKNGGFAPAVMGSFVSNAHSAIVPLVLAGLYSVFGTKRAASSAKPASTHRAKKGGKRNNRKNNRFANNA